MKQLTDEVIELACKAAASTGNARGVDSRDALAIVGAYQAALDTAQPVQVNAMLVEALGQWQTLANGGAETSTIVDGVKTQTMAQYTTYLERLEAVKKSTEVALAAAQQVAEPSYAAIHMEHCFQPPYETSCKYGDSDCPAQQAQPERVSTAMLEGLQQAADKLEVIEARRLERDKRLAVFEQAQPEPEQSDEEKLYGKELCDCGEFYGKPHDCQYQWGLGHVQQAQPEPVPSDTVWLSELLRRALPYVKDASVRYYDGTDGHSTRQSAKGLLEKIETAIKQGGQQ